MIQLICGMILAAIARVTVGVYVSKFSFLKYFEIPLTICIALLAAASLIVLVITIMNTIKKIWTNKGRGGRTRR